MKIRRYTGPSLEKLCDTVRDELGPDAVVVRAEPLRGLKNTLRKQFEVIAVVDDASADAQTLERRTPNGDIQKLCSLESQKWESMEARVAELQSDLQILARNMRLPGAEASAGAPDFAHDWDPRFLRIVKAQLPGLFKPETEEMAREGLGDCLQVQEGVPLPARGQGPQVIALVGPTGCGKTTTLAKLAARWSMDKHLKVGIITADTFRIAAVDQAKEYATLLGLEMSVVFSASEARRAVESMSDKDVILVDTPGRSLSDSVGLSSLKGILRAMAPVTTLLLIPAVSGRGHTQDLIREFDVFSPDYVVITKVDETRSHGILTTVASETTSPIAYLTCGQRVPEDIVVADKADLVRRLMGPADRVTGFGQQPAKVLEKACA